MTTSGLASAFAIYLLGLLALRRARYSLVGYLWGAFGLAAVLILTGQLAGWNVPLGNLQGSVLVAIGKALGSRFEMLAPATLLVPDPTGWSVLVIGIVIETISVPLKRMVTVSVSFRNFIPSPTTFPSIVIWS